MENDKTFELLTKMYSEFTNRMDTMSSRMDTMHTEMKEGFKSVNTRIDNLQIEVTNNTNAIIALENDLKPKVTALFDGYKQHSDQLERIEKQVSYQQEVIFRKIK